MNFINDEIKIDFAIPVNIQDFVEIAEKADKENDLGTYIAYADAIDIAAKNACVAGKLSQRQWNLLCMRYEQQ